MVERLAMGIDYSTLALHVCYGPGPNDPFRLKLPLHQVLDPEERAIEVASWLNELLDRIERNYPDLQLSLMCIEKPWLGKNVQTVITLTQIQAACIVTCRLRNWFVVQEDPNKIRKKILGVGTVPEKGGIKKLGQQWVRDTHHLETDLDTADSIVIWAYAQWLTENAVVST